MFFFYPNFQMSIEFPTNENLWGNDTSEESTTEKFNNVTAGNSGGFMIERCGNMDESYLSVWQGFQWWCEGVLFTG